VRQWRSEGFGSAFPVAPGLSPGLPVKRAPEFYPGLSTLWANVSKFRRQGDSSDAQAAQRAIDSGAQVIYFPPVGGSYRFDKTVIVRKNVRWVFGFRGDLWADRLNAPAFRIDTTAGPDVTLECWRAIFSSDGGGLLSNTPRTVVLRDGIPAARHPCRLEHRSRNR